MSVIVKVKFKDGSTADVDEQMLPQAQKAGAVVVNDAAPMSGNITVKFKDGSTAQIRADLKDKAIQSGGTIIDDVLKKKAQEPTQPSLGLGGENAASGVKGGGSVSTGLSPSKEEKTTDGNWVEETFAAPKRTIKQAALSLAELAQQQDNTNAAFLQQQAAFQNKPTDAISENMRTQKARLVAAGDPDAIADVVNTEKLKLDNRIKELRHLQSQVTTGGATEDEIRELEKMRDDKNWLLKDGVNTIENIYAKKAAALPDQSDAAKSTLGGELRSKLAKIDPVIYSNGRPQDASRGYTDQQDKVAALKQIPAGIDVDALLASDEYKNNTIAQALGSRYQTYKKYDQENEFHNISALNQAVINDKVETLQEIIKKEDEGIPTTFDERVLAMVYYDDIKAAEKQHKDLLNKYPQVKKDYEQSIVAETFAEVVRDARKGKYGDVQELTSERNLLSGNKLDEDWEIKAVAEKTGLSEDQVREYAKAAKVPSFLGISTRSLGNTFKDLEQGVNRLTMGKTDADVANREISETKYNTPRAFQLRVAGDDSNVNFDSILGTVFDVAPQALGFGLESLALKGAINLAEKGAVKYLKTLMPVADAKALQAAEKFLPANQFAKLMVKSGFAENEAMALAKIAKATDKAKSVAAVYVPGYVTSYESAYQEAAKYTNDEKKRKEYADGVAKANAVSELIFNDADFAEKLLKKVPSEEVFGRFLREATPFSAKDAFKARMARFAQITGYESVEELIPLVQETLGKEEIFDYQTSSKEFFNQALNTVIQTAIGTAPMGVMGASKLPTSDLIKSSLYEAGKQSEKFKAYFDEQFDKGVISNDQRNASNKLVNELAVITNNVPKENSEGKPLSQPQQNEVAFRELQNAALRTKQEKAPEGIKKGYEKNIQENQKVIDGIMGMPSEPKDDITTQRKVSEAKSKWKENINAINERTDINAEEKEALKEKEDLRHADEVAELQNPQIEKVSREKSSTDTKIISILEDEYQGTLREMQSEISADSRAKILSGLPQRIYERMEEDASVRGDSETKGKLQELRQRVSEEGLFTEEALRNMSESELADAPRRLLETIRSGLSLPPLSPDTAPTNATRTSNEKGGTDTDVERNSREGDESLLATIKAKADEGYNTTLSAAETPAEALDYVEDKFAENPVKFREDFGDDIADKVLKRTSTEKLKSGIDYLIENNPNDPAIPVLDKLISEREAADQKQTTNEEVSSGGETKTETNETNQPTVEGTQPVNTEAAKPNQETVDTTGQPAEGNEGIPANEEFDKMTSDIPNGGEVKKYLSGKTIQKYEGGELRNDQAITAQELLPALQHGVDIVEKAKEIFGEDYVTKTLDYVASQNLNPENKALIYVSLENELAKQRLENPTDLNLKKLQDLVRTASQAYLRSNSLAINMGRLRRFAEAGYDISKVTDAFFSNEEIENKKTVQEATEADGNEINKEAENVAGEQDVTPEMEQAIQEGIQEEVAKLYEKLPSDRKKRADKAIAALEAIQKRLRGKTYDAGLGVPVAFVDAGITVIKNAIKIGVKVADAIELGIQKIKESYGEKWEKEDEFRKDLTDEFKKEGIYSGDLTDAEKLERAKTTIKNKIENVREEILGKERAAKKDNKKLQEDLEYSRLKDELKTLEQLRDKYLPETKDPKEFEKQKDKKIQQLTDEIVELNKQIENEQKNPKEKKEDKFKQDADVQKMREEKLNKELVLEVYDPTPSLLVREILVEQGFGRVVPVKTKSGNQTRNILDWRKLATDAGSVDKIKENVEKAMEGKGYTPEMILRTKDAFEQEYINLRARVIENAQNDIAKKNKTTVTKNQKTAAKKLAEMYAFGLFDTQPGEFENTLNKAVGASVSDASFEEARRIAEAMQTVYTSSFNGVKLAETSSKFAIESLENRIRQLLAKESRTQGNFFYKAANLIRGYFDVSQTMILNNLKQAVENPFSGLEQNTMERIGSFFDKSAGTTKELVAQRRKAMKDVFKDMVMNGGIGYGKVDTTFVNRAHLDDTINKMSDNQLYHSIASVLTGKLTLNTMDAMWKASLTEQKFIHNLLKILTNPTNPNAMSKEAATLFVSEKLTGQTFKDARVTAEEIIDKLNTDAGEVVIPKNEQSISRFANDIVKSSLEMGGKITSEQIIAAYNAAYRSAGLGLGHVSNNYASTMISDYSAKLEGRINKSLQNKDWNKAALLTLKSILFRNVLNPFVGGGTNWLVLKIEKTGLGLFTGLGYRLANGKDSRLDMSTDIGAKKMEDALYYQARAKDSFVRGAIGGTITVLTFAAMKGVGGDDDYRKWRKKNLWAAKYIDIGTPEIMLADMAGKDKKVLNYVTKTFNKNDNFNPDSKIIKAIVYASQGKKELAWGAFGEGLGSKLNVPIPWRLAKDGQAIYQGVKGKDPYHGDYAPSKGFMSGVFQGGVIEWLGYRPNKK